MNRSFSPIRMFCISLFALSAACNHPDDEMAPERVSRASAASLVLAPEPALAPWANPVLQNLAPDGTLPSVWSPLGALNPFLRGVWASSPSNLYVAGWKGTIRRSTDGGGKWTQLVTGVTEDFNAIWGSGAGDVYAVGSNTVVHSGDSGQTWFRLPAPGLLWNGIWGSGPSDVYVMGWDQGTNSTQIIHSTDGGASWDRSSLGAGSDHCSGIWGSGPNDIYVACPAGKLYRSTDRSASWHLLSTGVTVELRAIWGSGPSDVYVVGRSGTILHSGDHGATWSPQSSGSTAPLFAITGGKGAVYVAAGRQILRTTDGGMTWAAVYTGPAGSSIWWGLWSGGSTLYAAGDSWGVLRSTDGGVSWDLRSQSPTAPSLNAVWGEGADLVAVGWSGGIVGSQDGGRLWSARTSPTTAALYDIGGSGPTDLYAVGASGTILHSTDAGYTWVAQSSGTMDYLTGIWSNGPKEVYVVGGTSVLTSADGGKSWNDVSPNKVVTFTAAWGSGPGNLFVVANNHYGYRTTDGGKSWTVVAVGADPTLYNFASIWGRANLLYAVGTQTTFGGGGSKTLGVIAQSIDGGLTWTQTDASAPLRAVWGTGPTEAYVAGDKGLILRSQDGGLSWLQQSCRSGTAAIADLWGAAPDNLFAVGSDQAISTSASGSGTILRSP